MLSASPPESSYNKKANVLTILCPNAVARCSLHSLSADSLMPSSVIRSPTLKFKTLMVLSIGRCSVSLFLLRMGFFSEFPPRCRTVAFWSLEFSKWKKISTATCTIIHSSYNMMCSGQKTFSAEQ